MNGQVLVVMICPILSVSGFEHRFLPTIRIGGALTPGVIGKAILWMWTGVDSDPQS